MRKPLATHCRLIMPMLVLLCNLTACSDETTPPPEEQPCEGRCDFFTEVCNEATGHCEPFGADGSTDGQEDAGQADVAVDQEPETTADLPDQVEDAPDLADLTEDVPDLAEEVSDVTDITEEDRDLGDPDTGEPDTADLGSDTGSDTDTAIDVETGDTGTDLVDTGDDELDPVSALSVTLDLPEAVIITWGYPAGVASGFVITQDAGLGLEEVTTLTFSSGGGSMRLPGLVPGQTYQIGVIAFIQDGDDRIDSPLAHRTIGVPIPENLVLTPDTTVLGSRHADEPEGVGQSEPLVAALTYSAHPPAQLYRDGAALQSNIILIFDSDNTTSAEIDLDGLVTAKLPGTARITAAYDGAPELLEAEVSVEVVDSESATGDLVVNLSSEDESPPNVLVLIDGPPSLLPELRADQTLETALPPGRYEVEVRRGEFIEVRSVVYIRSGQRTVLDRYLVREERCQLIGEEGGTIETTLASLDFPDFAVRENTVVCVTTLPSSASPWRGPSRFSPLLLPVSILITPKLELFHPATLTMTVDRGFAQFLDTELDAADLQTFITDRANRSLGPRATLELEESSASVSMFVDSIGGIVSFQGCYAMEPHEGACRISYDSCAAAQTSSLLQTAPECGLTADNFQSVDLDNTIDSSESHLLIPVVSRALSNLETRSEFAICRAQPCAPAGSCSCSGVADSLGCGVSFSGEIQQLRRDVDTLQWEDAATWNLFVPRDTICETQFDGCDGGGDTCPDNTTEDCDAVCPWAPPI